MPTRYIVIPQPITLKDPYTNEPLVGEGGKKEIWDFKVMIAKLMNNPKWAESYASMRIQEAIEKALDNAKDGVMVLAEEDWLKLKDAVESPRTQVGSQVINGYGIHPSLGRQILPLLAPIMDAKTERPTSAP